MITTALRQRILAEDGWRCQYCGAFATTLDHIIPKADRRRMKVKSDDEAYLVAACLDCNVRKGTRRLVPPMWAGRIADLEDWSGKRWKVWDGGKVIAEVLR